MIEPHSYRCKCAFVLKDDKEIYTQPFHWIDSKGRELTEIEPLFSLVDLAEMHLGVLEAEAILNETND